MAKDNRDPVEIFHEFGVYIPSRFIYFGSEFYGEDGSETGVDFESTKKLIKNLHILETLSKEPITIIMNSPGGEWLHGIAVYDYIKSIESKVIIRCSGFCMSMATVILQAADTIVGL